MCDPCVQFQPNLSLTSNSCNIPAASVSTAACFSSWVRYSHGALFPLSPELPGLAVGVLLRVAQPPHRSSATGSAERFCCVHGACKNEAAIYTSKCGNKGMTKGVSPLKRTLQHGRLLSEKKICSVKVSTLRQQKATQILLYFLLSLRRNTPLPFSMIIAHLPTLLPEFQTYFGAVTSKKCFFSEPEAVSPRVKCI